MQGTQLDKAAHRYLILIGKCCEQMVLDRARAGLAADQQPNVRHLRNALRDLLDRGLEGLEAEVRSGEDAIELQKAG